MISTLEKSFSSSGSSSSSSSSKRVTWSKNPPALKGPLFAAAQRKVHYTLGSFKRKVRRAESEGAAKHRLPASLAPLQGILKRPTAQFLGRDLDLNFDWSGCAEDFATYSTADLGLPELCSSTDFDDTPLSSALPTPPESDAASYQWESGSDYWSDEWEVTPKLPSGWSSPPRYYEPPRLGSFITPAPALDCTPDEPIPTPGEFLEGLVSSLQYTLIICSAASLLLLILALSALLFFTCGALIAAVTPVVFLAYGVMHAFSRTAYSAETIFQSAIEIGGCLGLWIGFSLVIALDYICEEIESMSTVVIRPLPLPIFLISLATLLPTFFGTNTYTLLSIAIGFLLSF